MAKARSAKEQQLFRTATGLTILVSAATILVATGVHVSKAKKKRDAAIAAAPVVVAAPAIEPRKPARHFVSKLTPSAIVARRTRAARPQKRRTLIGGLTFVAATITLSLLATTGSYALWNGATTVNAGTLATGSIALTINGSSNYTLAFPNTALAPGKSVLATATVANGGSTTLSVYAASTTVTANTKSLATYLDLIVTPVSSVAGCTTGLTGGTTGDLSSFSTTSAPYTIPAGAGTLVCFELKLDAAAPTSVQGGATSFTMNLVANQVRS